MTDTQGTEPTRGAQATRGTVNRAAHRGAVTTADRARHILHTQLEADFCQAPGSISRALQELRDYPEAESLPLLATVQPPSEKMGAARRRNDDIWELRVANYASIGILCAKHPRAAGQGHRLHARRPVELARRLRAATPAQRTAHPPTPSRSVARASTTRPAAPC